MHILVFSCSCVGVRCEGSCCWVSNACLEKMSTNGTATELDKLHVVY
jgi:hypothetical protein